MEPLKERNGMSVATVVLLLAIITQYNIEGGLITKEEMVICKALNKCPKHKVTMYIKPHHAKGSYVSCLICEREAEQNDHVGYEDMDTINEQIINSPHYEE